jgi:hypothetical protein
VLFHTPPGLELALRQEGIPCTRACSQTRQGLQAGRFVLYDNHRISKRKLHSLLASGQVALDIHDLRQVMPGVRDALAALVDHQGAPRLWQYGETRVSETVSRFHKPAIRQRLMHRLRTLILENGGVWVRVAPLPYPYRFAFNWRLDLDESGHEEDTLTTLAASRDLADCTTVFVCTSAYQSYHRVWSALRGLDVQPHGHYHTIYRDPRANLHNLERSVRTLIQLGFTPSGFAAPHGRWNPGLNHAIETLGLSYSSEFQLGHDDWPSYPWLGDRFAAVLQIPIHPVCEGLFLESGDSHPDHLTSALLSRINHAETAGETAFLYGHPEKRLGRMPEIITTLAHRIGQADRVWRVTMSRFAAWWNWRAKRAWKVYPTGQNRLFVQFAQWDPRYRISLEIDRGDHTANLPMTGPTCELHLDRLAYIRKQPRLDDAHPAPAPPVLAPRTWLQNWLDWERVTPIPELPERYWRDRLKKQIRRWRDPQTSRVPTS